ncbi:hypothetical protein QJQ45_028815 [Haematococcus lacustris]|nr:hypothetical protein QJQ45_028815 [Haematococcus lacustris]
MQRTSAPGAQQATQHNSSSGAVQQPSRTTGPNDSEGGCQDEAPAACCGNNGRPSSVSYAQALASARSPAGSVLTVFSPQAKLALRDAKPLLNDSAVPVVDAHYSAAGGDGASQAADANGCDTSCGRPSSALVPPQRSLPAAGEGDKLLKVVQAATSVPVVIGNTSPPAGSSTTGSSPPAAEQLAGSLDCDCKGAPGGQNCNGKCGDTYFGSGFFRWMSGKRCVAWWYLWKKHLLFICCSPPCMLLSRQCVDLGGQPLPQVVSKLHRLVRQLLTDHSQQHDLMRSKLQAAEQQATILARAKHDADSKLKEAETSLQQLKQQNQASQKKLIEQHQKFRCQALTEAEELRRQSTTAQAHSRRLSAEVEALQKASLRHVEEMETLEERLSTSNAQEEAVAADLRLCKEELAAAQFQLAKLSSPGPGSGGEGAHAQQGPYTAQRCAGGSFPVGFGSVEQKECLDQLSVATEQLAAVLVQGSNLQNPAVQDMFGAAKGSLDGTAALVSSWDRDSCAAALHHHVLNTALDIAQQQVDWYQHTAGAVLTKYLACLTSCPEAGRTELHGAMQQLQQAKSSTLFLVAQQQAPSHPATREAVGYVEGIRQHMQERLEQQLGLTCSCMACQVWRPQLVALAAAMTRVNLLLASLQSSCPGLQLVSRLEEWGAQEGQGACDAPVRQLLGKVEASRPLFLVRPGLVCAAAGGGRQVLVRQQAVALVPDPAWLEQLQWLEAEAARKQQEAEAARKQQEAEAARKQQEAEAARKQQEAEAARKQQEAEAARKQQEAEAARKQQEAEAARKQQEAEAARKEQEEWVRLVADEEHRHKLEEQRLLMEQSVERAKKLLHVKANLTAHKVMAYYQDPCSLPCLQDLVPGGHAGCLGPDTQDTWLDSSSQGGVGQCSDADSQAGCNQGHEIANVPHHQTSAPDQGQLVAAATSPPQQQPPPPPLLPPQQQSSPAYFPSHALQPPGSYQSNGSGHQAPDSSAHLGLESDRGAERQAAEAASSSSGGQAAAAGAAGSASGDAGGSTHMEVEEQHEADGYSMRTPPASMEEDTAGEGMVDATGRDEMLTAGTRLRGVRQPRRTLVGEAGFHGSAVLRIHPAAAVARLTAELQALRQAMERRDEEVQVLEERLSAACSGEEGVLANMRSIKENSSPHDGAACYMQEELASAQSQLAQLNSSSSRAGPGSGGEGVQAQQGSYTAQRCAGGSFPVGFGSVEQKECLDQLSVATEQLAAVLVQGNNLLHLVVQDMFKAARGSLEGTAALVSSWDRDSCAAALHHHVLNTALDIAQQQVDWYADSVVACLTSCPEARRTELHAVLQQLQQAKSSTLFLVAQQQAPSHPATWEASHYIMDIRQSMQRQLEQQLGLGSDKRACQVWRPQVVAVAAAMTRVNLLLASLQSSCPGLQLVSRLEEWVAQEGQGACEAPVHQLLGKVEARLEAGCSACPSQPVMPPSCVLPAPCSRPLFLVRPGLVCAAAGGGRQVLVRQQAVEVVPDLAWLEQQRLEQQRLEAEAARKQQEDRERLEAQEEEHRCQQEAQQLLDKERLAKEEQQHKQQEEKEGCLAQACKKERIQQKASLHQRPKWLEAPPSFLGACSQPLLQTVDRVQQLVADLRETLNRNARELVEAKERSEWDRAQVDKEKCEKQAAADKAALAILTEKMQDLEWELLERTETVQGLEKQLAEADAKKERALAEMGRVKGSTQQQQRRQWQQATQGWKQSEANMYYKAQEAERKLKLASSALAGANRDAAVKQEHADKQVKQLQAEQEKLARHNTAAEARVTQLTTDVSAMQTGRSQLVEQVEVLGQRLASRAAQEEEPAAELRLSKELLQTAEAQLAQLGNDSSVGLDSSSGEGKVHLGPYTAQRCAGGSFPVGFGSVEQRECLDQLSFATEQLAAVLVQGNNLQYLVVQDMLEAAKGSLDGTASLVSSWNRDSCAAALHHHVLNTALDIAQQQEDWYQHTAGALFTNYLACLTSCPESGRTELHAVLQQLQQAKSSTLFLVAQQQAPLHPITREAVGYVENIRQYMQGQLEQQLGLTYSYQASVAWRPELVLVAAAMTHVNLLLASLQSSCPGLQLVSRLEEQVAQEGQGACEAPEQQLLGRVNASRPLFLVRPGLVCAAAGGGRQVLVRQQAVQLVPDPAWLEQQQLEAEAARKQQEERERLEAEMKHRRKQEAQRLLEEERLAKEEQQEKQQEEKKGRLAQTCKVEQMQQQRSKWLEASPGFLGACSQDLSPGGAGCPGPDKQDTGLDSSAQGGVGQCSDADGQAGYSQSHENATVTHHQTNAPNQVQLLAAAASLAPGKQEHVAGLVLAVVLSALPCDVGHVGWVAGRPSQHHSVARFLVSLVAKVPTLFRSAGLHGQPLLQTVAQLEQAVADTSQAYNQQSQQEWDQAQVEKEELDKQAAAEKASGSQQHSMRMQPWLALGGGQGDDMFCCHLQETMAILTVKVQDLEWELLERTATVKELEKGLVEAKAEKERVLAELCRVKAAHFPLARKEAVSAVIAGACLVHGPAMADVETPMLALALYAFFWGKRMGCKGLSIASCCLACVSTCSIDSILHVIGHDAWSMVAHYPGSHSLPCLQELSHGGGHAGCPGPDTQDTRLDRPVQGGVRQCSDADSQAGCNQGHECAVASHHQASAPDQGQLVATAISLAAGQAKGGQGDANDPDQQLPAATVARLTIELQALRQAMERRDEEVKVLEERLSAACSGEVAVLANMRSVKCGLLLPHLHTWHTGAACYVQEELASAQSQLAQLNSSSSNSAGPGSGDEGVQAQQSPHTGQRCAGGSFPVGFGSVEQRECLDQLSIATEQLASTMLTANNLQYPPVRHLMKAAKGSLDGTASLVSSWDRDSCAAALHHHVLNTALDIAQQQEDWYQHTAGALFTNYLACLTSCPESGRTELHAVLQQLQQAKSSTLFLVAQQQAPSHPATREASQYIKAIDQHMQQQLERQLGLYRDEEACRFLRHQLVAVAAAMTWVNLLLASLQSSCPGLQLVSRLEEWGVQEGQQACEAPVRQLLGKVEESAGWRLPGLPAPLPVKLPSCVLPAPCSRPLFLVRPGLVCAAAGGGRQVMVRQQAVQLVPDPAWLEQQQRLKDEAARKQQEERERLEAEKEHRRKQEAQRLLEEERLAKEEQQQKQQEEKEGCLAQACKKERIQQKASMQPGPQWLEAPPSFLGACAQGSCSLLYSQDLSPGGAGCPGSDTQDTRLVSSSQGGDVQCSDADGQAGCSQSHENATVPHHQTNAPNQVQLLAAAASLAPGKVKGGQGDADALNQQLAACHDNRDVKVLCLRACRLSADLTVQPLLQTVDQVQQLVADLRHDYNRSVAKEQFDQEWDRAQVDKEELDKQAAADKVSGSQQHCISRQPWLALGGGLGNDMFCCHLQAALAILTEKMQDLEWELLERTETVQGLEKQLAEANADKERALAEMGRVKAQPPQLNSANTQSESKKLKLGGLPLLTWWFGPEQGWQCVDLNGSILPQEVFKLHTLIRKLQQQQRQQQQQQANQAWQQSQAALRSRAEAAERKLTSAINDLAWAKQDAAATQEWADKRVKQLQTQREELVKRNTTAEVAAVWLARTSMIYTSNFWWLQARITQLTTEVSAMQTGRSQLVEQVEVLGERLASRAAQEEEPAAELRLSKELLQTAEAQLAQLGNGSSVGLDSSSGEGKVHLGPYTAQRCAGGSFPVGFGSVEQRECLDQLSVATEQLACIMVPANNFRQPLTQHLLEAAKGSLEGTAALVSSWERDSCAAALHHHVLNTALGIAQQQVDWYQHTAGAVLAKYLACLTSCPESGRTGLHAVLQQLQQAKSSTLFLVAQQQAPSHPATREASQYMKDIDQYMQEQLQQQLGLTYSYHQACVAWRPELVAVAAAMTRVNLLLASLQSSCPGLQLVSRLEEQVAQEGQGACEAPVRQLLGKVEVSLSCRPSCVLPAPCSRPLFLVRPGLVCAAAGGGRQVMVRQQAVQLVPDPAWLEQQQRLKDEAARKQQEEREWLEAEEEHRRKQAAQRLLEEERLAKEEQRRQEKDAAAAKLQDEQQKVLHEEPKVAPGAAQQDAQQHQCPGASPEAEPYLRHYVSGMVGSRTSADATGGSSSA